MKITNIQIRMINGKERLKAVASVTFDGLITVDDIKIIQASKRLCISYPQNTYRQSIVIPRTPEISKAIEHKILGSYEESCKQVNNAS
ncbi:MAG TPA: septation protein SpoVG family protein [Caproicibacter sp.]|nr:septation protein SpoVG family protein [Caproicibacter sp.]